ncbi:hypothetical protein [Pyxidicoccus sp. MSG2]|uniref:hypothetical protein n=1 Tax=Pyxidicoccus sp. MSG2 TaxID=2996790 RepID=UPI00226FD666|nr:hypothetical protein [Pyxidicoccus sp. MSG2]MCY1020258.1 hypothetical protein [Pyxidicoccus sp. MSG2]
MKSFRSLRPRGAWALVCALALSACGESGLPDEQPPSGLETATSAQPLAFSSPMDFSELRGLPPPPATMDTTVAELLRVLPSPRFDDLRGVLSTRHKTTDKVRLLTSYARNYPVFLRGNQALLPQADGVFATQSPVVTAQTLAGNACSTTHACAELYVPSTEDLALQPYAAIVIVAPRVELAGPVDTGGTTLVIAAGDYVANGFPLSTTPGFRNPAVRPPDPTGSTPPAPPAGRDGRNAGSFVLYTNVLNGARVNVTGEKGDDGWNGLDAQAEGITTTISGNNGPNPTVSCTVPTITRQAQNGSNGGKGGKGGEVLIRYTSLTGPGLINEPYKSAPVTAEQCFMDDDLHCQSLRCRWNPAIALCDVLTEADNAQCSDGIDNDHNGYKDCQDYACSKNPHVTVCPEATWSPLAKESSAEACSDGKDNDGDGKTDCADPQCGMRGFCQQSRPSNSEFAEDLCADGKDNDGDGYKDSQDYSCVNYSGEAGDEECSDLLDNDGDGLGDCADPGCMPLAACARGPVLALTSGFEELSDAACSDGVDNDLDGDVDCADRECRINPKVTSACGSERTPVNCSDGIDNDGDGNVDCNDSGCSGNPYAKVCEPETYPFLQEATAATCSDGLDNDADGYKDCYDYQCSNSPLAGTVCGSTENTVAQCTDGVDNDGDFVIDCSDPNCSANPFYGDLLCRQKLATWHDISMSEPYNGRYTDTRAEFLNAAPIGGKKGLAGNRASKPVTVVVREAPPGSCEFYDDYLCVPREETRTCFVGTKATAGTAGAAGTVGTVRTLRAMRRDVDMLRALLAPQTWRVAQAQGNAHFKRGELQQAAFAYTQNIAEMGGILAQAGLVCDVAPTGRPFADVYLYGALCPLMAHDVTKLSFIQGQRNFHGLTKDSLLNPHVRYEALRSQFDYLYGVLDSSVGHWLTLSTTVQLSAWMAAHQTELNNEVTALGQERDVADQRIAVATAQLNALTQSMNNRKAAIASLTEAIQTTDTRIQEHYNAAGKDFGDFVLDLLGTVAKAYGGEFASAIGGKAGEALWGEVKKSFQSETSASPVSGSGPPSNESNSFQAAAWEALKTAATDAAKSKPFKDKLKSGGTELWDIVNGNQKKPARSVLADEVKKEILSQSQVEITLDLLDLQAQLSKAQAEYELAQMERDTVLLRQRNAVAARDALNSILAFGTGTELRQFDQLLIGQQVYSTAVRTLDQLTSRYWELIRVAEYQYLPFDPSNGDSAIPASFRSQYDFNLLTYPDMMTRLVDLDGLKTHYVLSSTKYYQRLPGSSFHPLTADELSRMKSLGELVSGTKTYVGARFQITAAELAASPELSLRNGHRVRNVRINVVNASGTKESVPAVLVRDTLDAFKLGNYRAEFELVEQDRYPSGATRQVLHYIPFTACVSRPPVCNLNDASCSTAFQTATFSDECSVAPDGSTPANNAFYDRSLLGEWTLLVDSASYTSLGVVQAVEVVFMATGTVI